MEGIMFYWFAWIGWVVYTFLQKKGNKRSIVCFTLLMLLIGSIHQVTVFQFEVGLSYLMVMTVCYIVISQERRSVIAYIFIVCMILTLAYVSFHLFELFDPVWLVFNRQWMLAFVIVYLTLMLIKNPTLRVVTACVGLAQGELLYAYVLHHLNFTIEIGSLRFLDGLAITVLILFSWNSIEYIASLLESIVQRKQGRKAGINQ